MKTFAAPSQEDADADFASAISALLVQLRVHEQAAASQAREVKRIARQIERLIGAFQTTPMPPAVRPPSPRRGGSSNSQNRRRPTDGQSDVARFSKLL